MGAFHNSICIPGRHRDEVEQHLERWLAARGFVRAEGPPLFDLDGDNERSVFVLGDRRWTVVINSHYDEDLRLIRELGSLAAPLLYLWVYDSDAWGYDLFTGGGFAGSFSSHPRVHASFVDQDEALRPAADPAALARLLGRPELGAALARVTRRRAPDQEEVCRELCELLGVEAALAGYDDLESGAAKLPPGWRADQLLFVRPDDPAGAVDLHAAELGGGSAVIEIPPELLADMVRVRRRLRRMMLLMKPLSRLAAARRRLAARWRGSRRGGARRSSGDATATALPIHFRIDGRRLTNERHGCRITLAAGAEPAPVPTKPSSVFGFRVDGVHVTCSARRLASLEEVLRRPARSRLLEDRGYRIDALPARRLLFELPAGASAGAVSPTRLGLHVVQTDQALYVFLYRRPEAGDRRADRTIEETVASFQLLAGAPAAAAGSADR